MKKIGVIGCGYWGPNLVRNFFLLKNCAVKTVSDLKHENLDKINSIYPRIHTTKDYKEILNDKEIDAVAIATPLFTHYKLAKEVLLAKKHVLVEKPMASSVAECEDLIKIAKANGLILMVDHTFLYTGAVNKIKETVDSGDLGELLYFDSERINLGLIQPDINVIWDLATHDISIMNYIFNKKALSVYAVASKHINKEVEEMAHITVKYEGGLVGHIHVSWLSPVKLRKVLVGGTKKMILWDDLSPSEKIKVYDKGVDIDLSKETPQTPIYRSGDIIIPKIDEQEALKVECKNFIEAITENKKPLTDGNGGLEVVRILEAADKSLETRKEVLL